MSLQAGIVFILTLKFKTWLHDRNVGQEVNSESVISKTE